MTIRAVCVSDRLCNALALCLKSFLFWNSNTDVREAHERLLFQRIVLKHVLHIWKSAECGSLNFHPLPLMFVRVFKIFSPLIPGLCHPVAPLGRSGACVLLWSFFWRATASMAFVIGRFGPMNAKLRGDVLGPAGFVREGADVGGSVQREELGRGLLFKLKHLTVRTMLKCECLSGLSDHLNKSLIELKVLGHWQVLS